MNPVVVQRQRADHAQRTVYALADEKRPDTGGNIAVGSTGSSG